MVFDAQTEVQALQNELQQVRSGLPAANFALIPHLTLSQYKGHEDPRTFEGFIKELNRVGSAMSWNESKLAQILPCLISADALAIYDVLPDGVKTDWRQFTTEMGKRLHNQNDVTSALSKLLQRSQRAGESISEFGMAIRDLVRLAYTDAGGFDDAARIKWEILHFRRGLSPRIKLEVGRIPVPATLDAAIAEAIAEADRQKDFQQDLMRSDQLVATAQLQLNNQELRNEMDQLRKQFSTLSVSAVHMPSPFSDRPRAFQGMRLTSDNRVADSPPYFDQERSWDLDHIDWSSHCHDTFRNQWDNRRRSPPAWQQGERRDRSIEGRRPQFRGVQRHRTGRLHYTQRRTWEPQDASDTAVRHGGRYQANSLFRSASPLGTPFLAVLALIVALVPPAHGQSSTSPDTAGSHLTSLPARLPCTPPPVNATSADHVNTAILPLNATSADHVNTTILPLSATDADHVNIAVLPLNAASADHVNATVPPLNVASCEHVNTTILPLSATNADHVNAAILQLSAANADHVNAANLQLSAANDGHSYAAILSPSTHNRLVIVFAIINIFVVLVVAAHAFRSHPSSCSHRPSYQLVNQPPDGADALRTSSVAKNNGQPTTAPTLCGIEYFAANARLRFINVQLHDRNVLALIDTGAEVSTVRPSLIQHLQLSYDADPTYSYATIASGAVLPFYGTATTTMSFARHLLQLRLLVATTDALPAPLIIGLDILSSLRQPVSFDFINNVLNVANTTVQLYEMPSTTFAKKFVPSSFGKLLRVPSLINDSYASTSNNNASPSNYDFAASTTRPSVDTPSSSTNEITTCRQPTTVIAKFNITARPLLVFRTKINGLKTSASFDSTFPSCRCRLSFCFAARLPFTKWTSTSRSSNGYVNRIFGTTFGVITLGKVTTDSRALLVTADKAFLPTLSSVPCSFKSSTPPCRSTSSAACRLPRSPFGLPGVDKPFRQI
ncbi:hypothetical protein AAVH_28836 [Aphelenchoides avenae]|nr:hypothetical protein AAVH_28836 [Aphelenchus avenae]